ncbi:MAG TPA: DNA-binding transcriptional regulator [Lachnospiraceae bacterium]|nr:DNA-binding transcriptional regulator [Lachnospiraceae bacterium]
MSKREDEKQLNGESRRQEMLAYLKNNREPVSGSHLAEVFQVSRQVVVQDIALLRAAKHEILSTNKGYLLPERGTVSRIFSVCHQDSEIAQELNAIVDYGGYVKDVFIHHEVYGILRAELGIRTRNQVRMLMRDLESGKSTPLKNITSGYHFHTVEADSEETLSLIETELKKLGFFVS